MDIRRTCELSAAPREPCIAQEHGGDLPWLRCEEEKKKTHPSVNPKSQASVHPQIYLEGGERQENTPNPILLAPLTVLCSLGHLYKSDHTRRAAVHSIAFSPRPHCREIHLCCPNPDAGISLRDQRKHLGSHKSLLRSMPPVLASEKMLAGGSSPCGLTPLVPG